MTETQEPTLSDAAIEAALARIDTELGTLFHRELVSSNEVADLLLDVRTLLLAPVRTGDEVQAAT